MKLLFDENLSSTLVPKLADLFPSSTHVKQLRLTQAEDETIWAYARDHGFTLISKDSDFQQRSLFFGAPPKVIWLRVGNCSTARIESLIREHTVTLHTFASDQEQSLLVLP